MSLDTELGAEFKKGINNLFTIIIYTAWNFREFFNNKALKYSKSRQLFSRPIQIFMLIILAIPMLHIIVFHIPILIPIAILIVILVVISLVTPIVILILIPTVIFPLWRFPCWRVYIYSVCLYSTYAGMFVHVRNLIGSGKSSSGNRIWVPYLKYTNICIYSHTWRRSLIFFLHLQVIQMYVRKYIYVYIYVHIQYIHIYVYWYIFNRHQE